jgi:signal transduction histidine kinase
VATRATEPFFTTKPAGEGTGLGLAIANEIVKHHCGSLTLAPGSTGKGTRVTVELPSINETRAQVSSLE